MSGAGESRSRTVQRQPDAPGPAGEPPGGQSAESRQLRQLLRRVANLDEAAFAEFYDATAARVYGLVLRLLRDRGYSEETTQEVYLQVWQTAGKYDPNQGTPLAWLLTLAHRRAIDRVRAEQSGANREARIGPALHSVPHDEVVESVTKRLEVEEVQRCLSTLTDLQTESVQMAYYRGLTYRDIADRLGVAVPTVKSRMRDGLIRLGTCLGVERHGG